MASAGDNNPVSQICQQLGPEDDGEPATVRFENGNERVQCSTNSPEFVHRNHRICQFILLRRLRLGLRTD